MSMNSSEQQLKEMLHELQSREKAQIISVSVLLAILQFLMLTGNVITLLVLALKPHMQTVPNMFVASLAISDFLQAAFAACPFGVPVLATSHWPYSYAACQFQGYFAVTMAVASTQTLALMAVNRYFRIVKPAADYARFFTKKKTLVIILVSWVYCACAPLPYIFSGHKMMFHPSKFFCHLEIDSRAFTAFLVTVYVGIPSCAIFYCYLEIFKTVRTHNNNFQSRSGGGGTVNVEEIKITRMLFVIVVSFNLCWTPILLIDMVDTIPGRWTYPREACVAYSFLAAISSALNPVMYGALNKNFRKEYLVMPRCNYCSSGNARVQPSIVKRRTDTTSTGPT